jgi:cardiolipin synthase
MRRMALQGGHQVRLLAGGSVYFPELLQAIDSAAVEVRLETYIFEFDASGTLVAQALERAAKRGVATYLVMDGVGTTTLPQEWTQRWNQAGVHWRQFLPLGRFGLLLPGRWRRMHRKLCVVDGAVAFCGGINVLDDFFEPGNGPLSSPRFDFAVHIRGPLVNDIHAATVQFWARLQATRQLRHFHLKEAAKFMQQAVRPDAPLSATETLQTLHSDVRAALVLRDNVLNRQSIEKVYRKAIAGARHEVTIANAYFLPGRKLRRALTEAAKRGVKVQLLLQGRYEYFMQFHAVRPLYRTLLDAGVEIYEYQPGYLHAKVAVIDGRWATVGSSNLDPLSLQLAREANVIIEDEHFAAELHERLMLAIQQHATRVQEESYANRPLRQRFLDQLAYGLMRIALFLAGRRY